MKLSNSIAALAMWSLACASASAQSTSVPSAAKVADALEKAKSFLYAQQKDGNWEAFQTEQKGAPLYHTNPDGAQWGGRTALVVYALLAAGESPNHPQLKQAIDFLGRADMKGIYSVGVRCQIYPLIPETPLVKQWAKRDGQMLTSAIAKTGKIKGLYNYFPGDPHQRIDHSSSQFGVLGIWACSTVGFEVAPGYWKAVQDAWTQRQFPDGGWDYDGDEGGFSSSVAMTAAGVATMLIAQDQITAGRDIECKGNVENKPVDRGLEWLGKNSLEQAFGLSGEWPMYALYGIHRIGIASGQKFIGKEDWYARGATTLVNRQGPDGSWLDHDRIIGTAFGTLFLARGRAPVVMNKLDFSAAAPADNKTAGSWNQRPRDLANLTYFMSEATEKTLNWQTLGLGATADDLNDAPILYLSGADLPDFDAAQQAKLRDYVERGGLILGNADCGNKLFATKFRKLGETLFPGREFRDLPATHPIYTTQQFRRDNWKNKTLAVTGLSNGVRELMVLIPNADLGKAWQARVGKAREEQLQLGANIFQYATDRTGGRVKGDASVVTPELNKDVKRSITVARLKYKGNWDPEPGGWRQLAAVMRNEHATDVKTDPIDITADCLSRVTLAHLTGTDKMNLDSAQRDALKQFVEKGGTLIIDAAGGSPAFQQDAESLVSSLTPTAAVALQESLKLDSPVFAAVKTEQLGYRSFTLTRPNADLRWGGLRGVPDAAGRFKVFYSRYDLSAGLVGQSVDGIIGYDPASATTVMANVLLYAGTK